MFFEEYFSINLRMTCASLAICLSAGLFSQALAQSYTTFSIPETTTKPTGINDAGVIAGYFVTTDFDVHGFVRSVDGTITTFDPTVSGDTYPIAIDKKGSIAGWYIDEDNSIHGFARTAKGKIASFDPPGSQRTIVTGLANAIVGYATIAEKVKGFVRYGGGTFTVFKYGGSQDTEPRAINKAGAIAGASRHKGFKARGFIRHPDGTFEALLERGLSVPLAINANGVVLAAGNFGKAFIRAPDGTVTQIEVPDAISFQTVSINDKSVVVGDFVDRNAVTHGFLWTKTQGAIPFDVPDMNITTPTAINNDGVVIGTCINNEAGTQEYGFVRTP